jgi:hypothetical protein
MVMVCFSKKLLLVAFIFSNSLVYGMKKAEKDVPSLRLLALKQLGVLVAGGEIEGVEHPKQILPYIPENMHDEFWQITSEHCLLCMKSGFLFMPISFKSESKSRTTKSLDFVAYQECGNIYIQLHLSKTTSYLTVVEVGHKRKDKLLAKFGWKTDDRVITLLSQTTFIGEDLWDIIPSEFLVEAYNIVQGKLD